MRMLIAGLIALLIANSGIAFAAEDGAGPRPSYKVGFTVREFVPSDPYDWRGSTHHALLTMIWYPAAADAIEKRQELGPPGNPLLDGGSAAPDAALAPSPTKFPLIVLSHGTGGTSANMAWLGTVLAAHGYIAVAVNHPGNNAIDGYTPQGFTLWWLRAADLSAIIDAMLADKMFAGRIDARRIAGAGHSLGGYTMIEIAGGITSLTHFKEFCASAEADGMCRPPNEFSDLRKSAVALQNDRSYRAAIDGQGRSYRDPRIRAIFVMAPALGPAFAPGSLEKIDIPVAIVVGAGDQAVPVASSARYFATKIPRAALTIFPGEAGHYIFAGLCLEAARATRPTLCSDPAGVDRAALEAETIRLALNFFARKLR